MSDGVKTRMLLGEVISDKMDKTVVVLTSITYRHPRFNKILRKTKKYKVHDESGVAKTGDTIEFHETRPLSKSKYMTLSRVIKSDVLASQRGRK